ncbi:TetR/AcrR family transcriptional regulator [Variovorax sp. WS11]|uniref:TetR/AcrR family transcriptional regulator n=1 Tax=Variovorax sp. WS11 TaxID=1105204 RepID=UPI0013DB7C20|nr:TetR/AcrR family transcriptional regulator [Variovorax sp. WS11]NDZ18558.1 TetR/AcrR family transcriptional regulator [Variovorax sp. WS11]
MNPLTDDAPPEADSDAGAAPAISEEALARLREWIDRGLLPELIPTRQARSLRTALAMIEAGRALLMTRSLEDLSVEMVCQRAGTTVGAFYGRFESKHAFFITMQRLQTARSRETLAGFTQRHEVDHADLDALCEEMVELTVSTFRSNLGVLRASLQHSKEGMWELFKQSGDRYRSVLVAKLAPHLKHLPVKERELRVLFAYQAMAGTLVHAVLNDPGPLKLEDAALNQELVRMVKSYLTAPRKTRRRPAP